MPWEKLGLLQPPTTEEQPTLNYMAVPTGVQITSNTWRIYFANRDENNRSIPQAFDFSLNDPKNIQTLHTKPYLTPGKLGTFDTHGIMPTWIQPYNEMLYMYYIGWNRGVDVPFRNALGLAISIDNGNSFQKYADGPILDRSPYDPCFVASCCTLIEDHKWRMWYLSCVEWQAIDDKLQHRYHIKYAESYDGIHWKRDGRICIDFKDENEYAISRPCVIKTSVGYEMWFSYRGDDYRIGYATSSDGLVWVRRDADVGIDISNNGWDSKMIEYPYVFDHNRQRYMLYNGNGYGRSGIGIAQWYR